MALKKRVICTLLWGETGLVKPRAFGQPRGRGSMMDAVRVMNRRNIDELIILDITATPSGRGPRFEEIKEFTSEVFCPVTVGGGVRTVDDIVRLLHAGADKVAICTGYFMDPGLIPDAAAKVGCQSIVACIDAHNDNPVFECGRRPTQMMSSTDIAHGLENLGAGEIIVTDIDRDGTMQGYNLELINRVSAEVKIPVIANGGCKDYADMKAAFDAGADAVAAGALWEFTEATPRAAAKYLNEAGVPTRLR